MLGPSVPFPNTVCRAFPTEPRNPERPGTPPASDRAVNVLAELVKSFGELRHRSKLLTSSATTQIPIDLDKALAFLPILHIIHALKHTCYLTLELICRNSTTIRSEKPFPSIRKIFFELFIV